MTNRRRSWFVLASVVLAVCGVAGQASAVWDPLLGGTPRADVPSEIVMSGTLAGRAVTGQIGPLGSTSDPANTYPPPTTGFTGLNEGFAGIITGNPPGAGPPPPTLSMYCINIRTPTAPNYGYNLGNWAEADASNVGYVARLLNDYYPTNPANPPLGSNGINNDNDRAAAVQASIWYFSDNYVLLPGDPLFAAVQAIVNAVRVQTPLPAPTPPSLSITPPTSTGDTNGVVGPYTIATDDPDGAVIRVTGGQMFSDAAGTVPIADGTLVPDGTQVWLRSAVVGTAVLSARATATVPSGNVYLYSGNIVGVTAAQKLILAESVDVATTTLATAEFTEPTTTTSTTTTTTTAPPTTATSTTITTSTSTSTSSDPATTTPLPTTGILPETGAGSTTTSTLPVMAAVFLVTGVVLVIVRRPRRRA